VDLAYAPETLSDLRDTNAPVLVRSVVVHKSAVLVIHD